jgi:hypothetical protein
LRIALRLKTNSSLSTPVVRAVVTRYHPMIYDRWRWSLPIEVADYSETVDGRRIAYTWDQQRDHIESMFINRVQPVIFEDIDGRQYEVKISDVRKSPTKFEVQADRSTTRLEYTYWVTMTMINSEVYTGGAA